MPSSMWLRWLGKLLLSFDCLYLQFVEDLLLSAGWGSSGWNKLFYLIRVFRWSAYFTFLRRLRWWLLSLHDLRALLQLRLIYLLACRFQSHNIELFGGLESLRLNERLFDVPLLSNLVLNRHLLVWFSLELIPKWRWGRFKIRLLLNLWSVFDN